jgi:DNA-directed RNA polymerase specialized sigma24 family protein
MGYSSPHDSAGPAFSSPLDFLPANVRRAVVLRVVDRLDYAEIADRLQCTEITARRRVVAGLRVVRGAR